MIGAEYPFIWRNMLKSLPITVLVNLRKRYYHVRDNTLMIAWADDLPEDGYTELLESIAGALPAREGMRFRKELSARRLKEAFDKGDAIEVVLEPSIIPGTKHSVRTRVVFGSGGRGEVFELRMDEAIE